LNIDIAAVGKLRENFYKEAADEYLKRLSRYAKVRVLEAEEVKKPDEISPALSRKIKEQEADRLRKFYRPGAYRIALCIDGKEMDSVEFSKKLEDIALGGRDSIQFFIGGAIGLGDSLIGEADARISFSQMTFPHQLMRVILLEQIYRAFRIIKGEPYHK
jgi:23S rRNA (pseudouridine1915-N3)-methyltransferase